ncbi:hypothetical protein PENTCL1PPCAC_16515, partial [Pristionchus entomophagus]
MLRSRRNLMDRVYRVPMYVCAVHGMLLCLLNALFNFVHIFRDGTFVALLFAPLANLLPRVVCHGIFEVALVLTIMTWILIPSHSTLQFIAVSRHIFSYNLSIARRLFAAFILPVACIVCVAFFAPCFLPSPGFEQIIDQIAHELFSLNQQQRVIAYGSTLRFAHINSGRSLLEILIGIVLVPYFFSYALFSTCVILIRRRLGAFGVSLSERTMKIQRSFYVMQMLQGLLPLAIIAVPLIFFIIGTLLQLSLDLATLIFTAFLWACPWVQVVQ